MTGENQAAARVLIADDHELVSEGLQRLLLEDGYEVLPPVMDGVAAVALARTSQPDIAILDYDMPGATGMEVMREIRRWSPKTKVVILTGRASPPLLATLKDVGADGLFLKSEEPDALRAGIASVLAGATVFPPLDVEGKTSLSRREIQTLEGIAQGLTNPAIAEQLNISVKTVESHRSSLMRKLGVRSTASLIVSAVREGLISP
ncbi:MAG: response regulator transcription factor [Pseudomonadota bacterium]